MLPHTKCAKRHAKIEGKICFETFFPVPVQQPTEPPTTDLEKSLLDEKFSLAAVGGRAFTLSFFLSPFAAFSSFYL